MGLYSVSLLAWKMGPAGECPGCCCEAGETAEAVPLWKKELKVQRGGMRGIRLCSSGFAIHW